MTVEDIHTSGDPYILMKYLVIGLRLHEKTPEDLANLLTFFIEQIESVEGSVL